MQHLGSRCNWQVQSHQLRAQPPRLMHHNLAEGLMVSDNIKIALSKEFW